MLTVTINFTLHEITSYEQLFGEGRRTERVEEEPRQPRVNHARIAPIISDQPNVLLHPKALTRRDVNKIFKSSDTDSKTASTIIYKFGEKPFSALEASRKEEGKIRMGQWLFDNKKIEKKRDGLPRFVNTCHSEVKKSQKGIRKATMKNVSRIIAKRNKKMAQMTRMSVRLRNRILSSSGISKRNKPRETNTTNGQTRAQKLGSSCVQSNKPLVTPTRFSSRQKSNETVRTKEAHRTTKTTKSVIFSSRVVGSHK